MKKFISIFLGLMSFFAALFISINSATVNAAVTTVNDTAQDFTKTDTFNYRGKNYTIQNYSESIETYTKYLKTKNVDLVDNFIFGRGSYFDELDYTDWCYLNFDDAITQIIPKKYFMYENTYTFIGDEYGFFITTEKESYWKDNNKFFTGNYRSSVIVFDIITDFDLITNIDWGEIKVSVLFSAKYICVSPTSEFILRRQSVSDSFACFSRVERGDELDSTSYYVSPLIDGEFTADSNEYYLSDITFGAWIENEQSLNPDDKNYDPLKDEGYYFQENRFLYNCKAIYDTHPTEEENLEMLCSLLGDYAALGEWVLGLDPSEEELSFASSYFALDTISKLTSLSLISHVYGPFLNLIEYCYENYDPGINQVTNAVEIKESYFISRRDQVDCYGGLIKALFAYFKNFDDFDVGYQGGDFASMNFKVAKGNDTTPKELTRINYDIYLSVITLDSYNEVIEVSNAEVVNHEVFGTPIYYDAFLGDNNELSLLPNGTNYFNFTPKYSGKYELYCYAFNNITISDYNYSFSGTHVTFPISATSNRPHYFSVKNNTSTSINNCFNIDICDDITDISINPYDSYIVKLNNVTGFNKLSFNNSNCTIKLLDTNFYELVISSDNTIYYDFNNEYYFVVITNNSSNIVTSSLSYTNNLSDISLGSVTFNTTGDDIFYKFTTNEAGNYYIVDKNLNPSYSFYTFNDTTKISPTIEINSNYIRYCFYLGNNQTYYLGCESISQCIDNVSIDFSHSESAYEFFFNENNVELSDSIYLKHNEYTIITLTISDVFVDIEDITILYDPDYFTYDSNGKLSVKSNANISPYGTTITFKDNTNAVIGVFHIYILPEFTIDFIVNSNSTTCKTLKWQIGASDLNYKLSITYNLTSSNQFVEDTISIKNNGVFYLDIHTLFSSVNSNNVIGVFEILKIEYTQTSTGSVIVLYNQNNNTGPYTFTKDPVTINLLFAGGSGSSNDPYLISNAWELNNMRYITSSYYNYATGTTEQMINSHFKLINTINVFDGFIPLPGLRTSFINSNPSNIISIKNLITDGSYKGNGLFRYIHQGSVKNINLKIYGEDFTNDSILSYKGGLAGYTYSSTIDSCTIQTNYNMNQSFNSSNVYTGGVVGYMFTGSKIKNTTSIFYYLGNGIAGGIAGYISNGTIESCISKGTINNNSLGTNSGGIVGYISSGTINSCISNINIWTYGNSGGIVGYLNNGTISSCTSNGYINQNYDVDSITSDSQNPCSAGIVGYMKAGILTYNHVNKPTNSTYLINWCGSTDSDNKNLKPCLGLIVGRKIGGTCNSTNTTSGNVKNNIGNLTDFISWFKKYTQYEYVSTSYTKLIAREG